MLELDEYEMDGIAKLLHIAKRFADRGRLDLLLQASGKDAILSVETYLELEYDLPCLIFEDVTVQRHPEDDWRMFSERTVYIMRDSLLSRFDQLCREYEAIQGLQVRLDDEKNPERKYRWLASRGRPHGVRCPAWIHVTGNPSATTAYLTEGGLKGDVASFLDDDALFLCFAGVTAVKHLEDTLRQMEQIQEVVITLDMDKLMNWRVQNALTKIIALVRSIRGIKIRVMNWNMTFKGIDDFYLARNYAAKQGVNILDMSSNFITIYLEDLWKREYPKQDRGFIHTCEWEELTLPVNELTADPPKDMRKAKNYLRLLQEGTADFPPLVCVNRMVIDGQHRFWAYRQAGFQQVKVYQNKPWAMPAAA